MTKLIYTIIVLALSLFFFFLVSKGLDKIESQRQEIARLETKIVWLEHTDEFMLAIEAMPDMERDELKATNELIKQRKRK